MKLTDALALYAAVLSTAIAAWNFVQARPRFKVDMLLGIDGPDGAIKSGAFIIIRNASSRDVHIASIGVLIPFRHVRIAERLASVWQLKRWVRAMGWASSSLSNYGIEDGPVTIEPGQSHRVFIEDTKIDEMLADASCRRLRAHVQDELWKNVNSRSLALPVIKHDDG